MNNWFRFFEVLPLTYELCMSAKYLDQYVIWTKLVANIII